MLVRVHLDIFIGGVQLVNEWGIVSLSKGEVRE